MNISNFDDSSKSDPSNSLFYEKSLNKERIEVPSSSISIGSAILVLAREILHLANGINVLHTPVLFIIVTSFSLAVGHPASINYQAR